MPTSAPASPLAGRRVRLGRSIRAYQRAVKRGHLKLRTSMMIRENLLPRLVELGIMQGWEQSRLRVGPIKMFIDGSLIGRTAAVTQPFVNDPGPTIWG